MKIRLKEGDYVPYGITKGKEYVVEKETEHHYHCVGDDVSRKLLLLDKHDFDVVPEVKESDIPSLEAMNQKSKVGTSKILGYECPMDLYGGSIKKGDIYSKCINDNYYEPNSFNNVSHLLPAEIVETWNPVYEEDIYVGGEKVELNIDKDFAYIHGIWITKEDLELLRDIPRETYDKIIKKLGVAENQES